MNVFLEKAIKELKNKKLDAFIFHLSNENLYEFVDDYDNPLIELTGFTGDTAEFLLVKNKAYLLVDGRFTIAAKNEKNDSRINVVEIDGGYTNVDLYKKVLKKGYTVGFNSKIVSMVQVQKLKKVFDVLGVTMKPFDNFLSKEIKNVKKNYFYMSSAPLFLLDKKSYTYEAKEKIRYAMDKIDFPFYVTSAIEEIAYITNIRYRFADINDHDPLFKSFFIMNKKKSYLYIKDYLEESAKVYLEKNAIEVRLYDDFYEDLKHFKYKDKVMIDPYINSYHVCKMISAKDNNLKDSPFIEIMSIKGEKEIKNLRKCNVIDGVAITKAIYKLKTHMTYKNEYEVLKMVDNMRREVGKTDFLCNSFKTIVAYKENSAICHYVPQKDKSKKLKNESLLLIDSGGDYIYGTTDITRTISLYKNKKDIPKEIKKHYNMVLNAMIKLSMQKFPYGITGCELDIIARSDMYNEYIDFGHSTGHGIGYISNVHEGQNRIGPGIRRNFLANVFEAGQVVSDEPGLYFENKYGIRIENDLLCQKVKENKYDEFLGFETLTICPFDKDLIDKKYLDEKVIIELKKYNDFVYKKLSPYLDSKENAWLKEQTCL